MKMEQQDNNKAKKAFLIEVEEQKLKALDTHLNEIWSSRASFFRKLIDDYISTNKSLIIKSFNKIQRYLDKYSHTPMAQLMDRNRDWIVKDLEKFHDPEEFRLRSLLDTYSTDIGLRGFPDGEHVMKDIYHWLRYLSMNPNNPKDFFEYTDFKYLNPDLKV